MIKHLTARIVGSAILAGVLASLILALVQAPTVSAESNDVVNEQITCNHIAGAVFANVEPTLPEYEMEESHIGYTTSKLNIRSLPSVDDGTVIGTYDFNMEICYYEENDNWVMVLDPIDAYQYGYVCKDYIADEPYEPEEYEYNGPVLNRISGVCYGPNGKESYYNLPMYGVVKIMRGLGYDYQYWVRSDGAKMYGDYVMIAADLNKYKKGTILETSLGTGIVCDTGDFTTNGSGVVFDIATSW